MNKLMLTTYGLGLAFLAACMSTENPPSAGGKSPETAKPGFKPAPIGIDPALIYAHMPDSAAPRVDSLRLLAGEAEATKSAGTRNALAKASIEPSITLCTAINYTGTCKVVPAGRDYNDLRFLTVWGNDAISSIKVTPETMVYLCDANNWGGPCYPVYQNIPDFRQFPDNGTTFNFNDKVTSFKFQLGSQGESMYLFDGPDRGGASCELLYPFDYNYPPCNFNDRTSSAVNYNSHEGQFWSGATWSQSYMWVPSIYEVKTMPASWDNVVSAWEWF